MGNYKKPVMDHPSSGKAPKGMNNPASGATRGGPGMGSPAVPKDSRTMSPTAPSGGRPHPGMGKDINTASRKKNPQPITYARPGKTQTTW